MREKLVLIAILVAYAGFAAAGIRRPIYYHQDFNAAQVGEHAKNYLWHGLAKTRGIMLDTSGRKLDYYSRWQDRFYPDHPPLPDLALAGMFALLGPHEWVVRLQGHLFALGCLVLFYFLVRHWYGGRTSVLATALLALLPMFAYFSSVTVHQVPTLFFILAGLLAYSHRKWGWLVLFQFLACYSDWPGYYLAVVVFVHLGFVERRWKIAWIFPALNVAIFGVYLLHVYAADPTGGALHRLWRVLGNRSSPVPLFDYLSTEGMEAAKYFTISGLACAAGWMIARLRHREPGDRFVLCLPLLALDEAWLQTICHGHDYYLYYLAPFVAVAVARAMMELSTTKWRVALTSVLAAGLIAQSAWILHRRMTKPSLYEFSYRLGVALRETTAPDDKILIMVHDIAFLTSFVGERFTDNYHRNPNWYLRRGIGWVDPIAPEELLARLERNPEGYAWVVTAEKTAATAAVEYFRTIRPEDYERDMRGFGVETLPSPLLDRLDRIAVARVERGGFIFFRLTPRP